jgi:hypothetical protein
VLIFQVPRVGKQHNSIQNSDRSGSHLKDSDYLTITVDRTNVIKYSALNINCKYLYVSYSYEIRSWLVQGMRDAIVSGSCLV